IIAEVFKAVLGPGRHEKKVSRLESTPFAVVKEYASPAKHDVKLVLFVRRLFIRSRGHPKCYIEGATLQDADGAPARLSLGQTDYMATSWLAHASYLVLLS